MAAMPSRMEDRTSVEVDCVGRNEWYGILENFEDISVFQAWDFGRVAHQNRTLSHVVVRQGAEIVAAAQVLLRQVPGIGGIALVMWGPLWRRRGRPADPSVLRLALRALKDEYVERRGLFLRIVPNIAEGQDREALAALKELGMQRSEHVAPYRTLMVDLRRDEADIRANLSTDWRRGLNKAERAGIEIVEGTGQELFDTIDGIYGELQRRKGFEAFDPRIFSRVHHALPERHKMRAFVALHEGAPVAGVTVSLFGRIGQMQNSATLVPALKINASYLLQWRALLWIKSMGGEWYDLHGANAEANPGVYRFKRGLAGKTADDTVYIGAFDSAGPFASRILVESGQTVRTFMRKVLKAPYALAG